MGGGGTEGECVEGPGEADPNFSVNVPDDGGPVSDWSDTGSDASDSGSESGSEK